MKENEDITENGKYYMPSIEEFHVGFEYEKHEGHRIYYKPEFPVEHKWVSKKWDEKQDRIGTLRCKIYEKVIRVKHLDHDDIISLGWEPIDNMTHSYKSGQYLLQKDNACGVVINMASWVFDRTGLSKICLFYGQVRNISELKRIMNQVGAIRN